ncbi:PAS domain S-box-containing protein [Formivibrio citricus]|uniref:histidine kinase n=1 Tax=Formivibrio citricus TaxID=83765 RepID=A0A1I4YDE8_9NEIS|nr:PAS domain S-box protein [Formivibrio citricus]SFN35609.1 PAS domain S-box-containing protein [Formivibrio citricus]
MTEEVLVGIIRQFFQENEAWLWQRMKEYAAADDYYRFIGVLSPAWQTAIPELSEALAAVLSELMVAHPFPGAVEVDGWPEFSLFVEAEKARHGQHGLNCQGSLEVLKCYRRSYLALVDEKAVQQWPGLSSALERLFDSLELAFFHALGNGAPQSNAPSQSEAWALSGFLPSVVETTSDFIFVKDRKGRYLMSNPAANRFLGLMPDEIGRVRDSDLFPDDECDFLHANDLYVLESGRAQTFEENITTRDGLGRTLQITKCPVRDENGTVSGIFCVAREITMRRAMEEQLRIEAKQLEIALEASKQGLWTLEVQSGNGTFSEGYYSILGYSSGEFPSDFPTFLSLIHPDDRERVQADILRDIQEKKDLYRHVFRMRAKDGGWRWIVSYGRAVARDADDAPTRLVGTHMDITEEHLREAALAHSEMLFRSCFENSMVGIVIMLPSERWEQVNPAFCNMLGYTKEELLEKNWAEITLPEDISLSRDSIGKMHRGELDYCELQKRYVRKDGSVMTAELRVQAVRDEQHVIEYFVLIIDDVTQVRQREAEQAAGMEALRKLNRQLEEAQNQLLQSEKMASIGQLAAGVAHEINNPIGFVNSNLGTLDNYVHDLLKLIDAYETCQSLPASEHDSQLQRIEALKKQIDLPFLQHDVVQLLLESRDGLNRVKKIVQDLKSFSRAGDVEWQWADLHQGLESTLNIVWNELKYKCQLVKEYAELPAVYCIPPQINQVFMNLLVNAAQAIEDRGVVTIRSGVEGEHVWIEIADTGKGIPPDNLKRIFEPFFTTKPVGQGTGLGLSLSWNIINSHHGRLEVRSEEGAGTTFRITLPVRQSETIQEQDAL